jgi:hypothetical protein
VYLGGRPAAGVKVEAFRLEGSAPGEESRELAGSVAQTAADGTFSWDDLAAGAHILVVWRQVGEPRPDTEAELKGRFVVVAGEEAVLEIGKDEGAVTLRGTILGLETHETVWARLRLVPVDAAGQETGGDEHSVRTYREWGWQWTFKGVARGRYEPRLTYYHQEDVPLRLPPIEVTESGDVELTVVAK